MKVRAQMKVYDAWNVYLYGMLRVSGLVLAGFVVWWVLSALFFKQYAWISPSVILSCAALCAFFGAVGFRCDVKRGELADRLATAYRKMTRTEENFLRALSEGWPPFNWAGTSESVRFLFPRIGTGQRFLSQLLEEDGIPAANLLFLIGDGIIEFTAYDGTCQVRFAEKRWYAVDAMCAAGFEKWDPDFQELSELEATQQSPT
jgi:hypothetical protein